MSRGQEDRTIRVFITGSHGMLADALFKVLIGDRFQVSGMDIDQLDITRRDQVMEIIPSHKPDVIINCAAYTDVDGAESHVKEAFAINGYALEFLCEAANSIEARLLHISTDYVFSGHKKSPYKESDTPEPISVYGKSKWLGEMIVDKNARNYTIVRTSGLFGIKGRCFPQTILRLLDIQNEINVVYDQVLSPTYTVHLAQGIRCLVEKPLQGIVHVTNRESVSWFDFSRQVALLSGRDPSRIKPISTADFGAAAPRPAYSVLSNYRFEIHCGYKLPPWRDGLNRYLQEAK